MHRLDAYGLEGCYFITSNVYDVPSWKDLHQLQFYSTNMYTIIPPLQGVSILYEMGPVLGVGTYGTVYHAKRIQQMQSSDSRNIVIKEQETKDISSYTLHEAVLHAIVYRTFTEIGLGFAIPKLYEVTAHTKQSYCMAMEWVPGSTLLDYFHIYLSRITNAATCAILPESLEQSRQKNDALVLDVLMQIAIYLTILQKRLQFYHRDLKLNNVLIRHTSARSRSILRRLDHPLLSKPWDCRHDVVMIDFGGSCMKGTPMFEAGTFFKSPSIQQGRDLALLIYSIHAFFPLDQYVSPLLWSFLEQSTTGHMGSTPISLLHGIQTDGSPCPKGSKIPFDEGIYYFLQKDSVDLPGCDPFVFLKNANDSL